MAPAQPPPAPAPIAAVIPVTALKARPAGGWMPGPTLAEVDEGRPFRLDVRDTSVVLIRSGDRVQAFRNECAHQGLPIDGGRIDRESGTLTCPWHGFRFDCVTGECLTAPHVQLEAALRARRAGCGAGPRRLTCAPCPVRGWGAIAGRTGAARRPSLKLAGLGAAGRLAGRAPSRGRRLRQPPRADLVRPPGGRPCDRRRRARPGRLRPRGPARRRSRRRQRPPPADRCHGDRRPPLRRRRVAPPHPHLGPRSRRQRYTSGCRARPDRLRGRRAERRRRGVGIHVLLAVRRWLGGGSFRGDRHRQSSRPGLGRRARAGPAGRPRAGPGWTGPGIREPRRCAERPVVSLAACRRR